MKDEIEEIKLILLGESGVGKTAIIKRYIYDKFNLDNTPNTSMNYVEKDILINKKNIRLNIWDTIGQEKYRSLSKMFLNETQIVILVYSINDQKSFTELNYWYNLYKEQLGDNIVLGIAGNKIDLYLNQEVSEQQGKEFATQNKGFFAQLSAKENKAGIDEFITNLVKQYLTMKEQKLKIDEFEIVETRAKGIVLNDKKLEDFGYNEEGCCKSKTKARRKRYEEILKNSNGYIDSIFLGPIGVGKTSLIKRIQGKPFDENEKHTEEINKYVIEYTNPSSTMQIILNINDINIQQRENKLTQNALKNSKIYFLVYDLNNNDSFNDIQNWLEAIQRFKKENNQKDIVFIIIGNKQDLQKNDNKLEQNNDDNKQEGKNFGDEANIIFYKTTAKDDKVIKEIIGIAIETYINLPNK